MMYSIVIILILDITPAELQLNKANYFYTETPFLDLDFSIKNHGIISSKHYDKRDDFYF